MNWPTTEALRNLTQKCEARARLVSDVARLSSLKGLIINDFRRGLYRVIEARLHLWEPAAPEFGAATPLSPRQ